MATYSIPHQDRAHLTEKRLLDALDELLLQKPLSQLTIAEIAERAHVSRGAFLKRFGGKKQALMVLWERYGQRALVVKQRLLDGLSHHRNIEDGCSAISVEIEKLQQSDFSANRAMFDLFEEELQANPVTKMVFMECVDLMHRLRQRFGEGTVVRNEQDFNAAQLLITLNYNYVMKAMPGFPSDSEQRHRLVGRLAATTLTTP